MILRLEVFPFYFILAAITFVATARGQRFNSLSLPTFFDDDDFVKDNVHFFGPPTGEFWQQFWDVFNYKGPMQENSFSRPYTSSIDRPTFRPVIRPVERLPLGPIIRPVDRPRTRPYFPEYSSYEEQYSAPEYYVPRRETAGQQVTTVNEDEYNRYRDYFYRRYGNNFLD